MARKCDLRFVKVESVGIWHKRLKWLQSVVGIMRNFVRFGFVTARTHKCRWNGAKWDRRLP